MCAAAAKNIKNAVGPMRPRYFDFRMVALWAIFLIFIITFAKLGSTDILDAKFFYTGAEATKFFSSLSNKAAFHYLVNEFFDLGFIVVYTAILFLSLKRVFYKVPNIKFFAILPAGLDFFETKTVIDCLMANGPIAKNYVWLGYVTSAKWITGGFLMLLFLIKFFKITYVGLKSRS